MAIGYRFTGGSLIQRSVRLVVRSWAALLVVASAAAGAYGLYGQRGSSCQSNLKQYALAMLMYSQDYDEMLPPMKFPAQVHNRVLPYTKNRSIFTCPETNTDYLPNPALNYMHQAGIESPATMMMLRDAKAHRDDAGKPTWNVAYADGHVNEVDKEPKLGKVNPSPPPPTPPTRQQRLLSVQFSLAAARDELKRIDRRIKELEAQERRLKAKGS